MTLSEFGFLHWAFVVLGTFGFASFLVWVFEDIDSIGFLFTLVCTAAVTLLIANEFTPSEDERDRIEAVEDARRAKERSIPQRVSEFDDGCILYRFYDRSDRENFVTRCPDRTTTTSKHTRTQGKSTVTDTTTIETINQ
jgi:hypothetical protein